MFILQTNQNTQFGGHHLKFGQFTFYFLEYIIHIILQFHYSSIDFEGCNNPDYEKIRNFYFERRGPVKMKGKSDPMITYTLRRRHPRPTPPSHSMNPPPPRNDSTDVISSPSNNQNFFSLHRKPQAYEGAGQRRFRKHRRSNMLGRFSASSKQITIIDLKWVPHLNELCI